MGTACAPAYANIFMTELEQKYINLLIKDKSIVFYTILMISLWYGPNLKNSLKNLSVN